MSITKLFIVEDHDVFRKILITLLSREADFCVCGEAASGTEALAQLTHTLPDILVVDISMTGMNGFTLLQKVQARWPDLPCIILSGHLQSIYAEQASTVRVAAYIDKANAHEIVPTIRRVAMNFQPGDSAADFPTSKR